MAASAKRKAIIELSIDRGKLLPGLADARKKLQGFGGSVAKTTMAGVKGVGSALMGGFGIQGAGQITDMVGEIMDVEKGLTRLQINGSMTGAELASFRQTLMQTSAASGVARNEILKGAAAYVAFTGDAAGAKQAMGLFAEVANATGASMEDIASTASAMKANLKIDPADFRAAFDILATQGKMGAVEIANLAKELSGVAPQFSKFAGGTGVSGMAKLGAIAQVMRKDFGGIEETMTGFRGIMTQVTRYATKLKGVGVNVYGIDPKTKKKYKRDFEDIILDFKKARDAGKIDDTLMQGLLGESRSVNAMNSAIDRYEELQNLKRQSLGSDAIAKDNATYLASTSGKIATAWNSIKNSLAQALTPDRIEQLANALMLAADAFTRVVGGIDKAIDWVGRKAHGPARKVEWDDMASYGKLAYDSSTDLNSLSLDERKGVDRIRETRTYNDTADRILALERNGGVSVGSTYAAMAAAAKAGPHAMGTGESGEWQAGEQYLSKAGINKEAVVAPLREAAKAMAADFASAMQKTLSAATLNIDGSSVAKSVGGAQVHRTRPGGRH